MSSKIIKFYLFPDFSCDERRVDDDHVEVPLQGAVYVFWLVEIIEDKARVFVELLVELHY
jgi:hypothetical protein